MKHYNSPGVVVTHHRAQKTIESDTIMTRFIATMIMTLTFMSDVDRDRKSVIATPVSYMDFSVFFNTFRSLPYPCSKLCHTVYYFHILFLYTTYIYTTLYSNILFTATTWVE